MQQFLFLQGIGYCSEKYDEVHTKQLACDPKFVALCREDRVVVNHIRRGDFKIDRVKINNRYLDSVEYENILYVKKDTFVMKKEE